VFREIYFLHFFPALFCCRKGSWRSSRFPFCEESLLPSLQLPIPVGCELPPFFWLTDSPQLTPPSASKDILLAIYSLSDPPQFYSNPEFFLVFFSPGEGEGHWRAVFPFLSLGRGGEDRSPLFSSCGFVKFSFFPRGISIPLLILRPIFVLPFFLPFPLLVAEKEVFISLPMPIPFLLSYSHRKRLTQVPFFRKSSAISCKDIRPSLFKV